MDETMKRFEVIFSEEDMHRMSISDRDGFCVDVHGMSCQQASRFLKNMIALIDCTFSMNIIHGYNHGHAIKDMVRNRTLSKNKQVKAESVNWNPGMTKLTIAS